MLGAPRRAAQFSGRIRTLVYREARQEVARVIQDFTLTDAQLPEFEWVCALLDAFAAFCSNGHWRHRALVRFWGDSFCHS